MRLEDIKYDFPKMPEDMRIMIQKEVEKQVKTERPKFGKGKFAMGRTAVASVAAVMLLGTTVFASVGFYQMQQKKIGAHGVNINISRTQALNEIKEKQTLKIPDVKMEVGYLPEGMVKTQRGKYSFENALNQGGVSIAFYRMDGGDDQFEIQHGDVLTSEDFTANGLQGVYLEYPDLYGEDITFNQRIYLAFTDVHYVMEMFVASDVTKEEALKIAENIKLIPTEDKEDDEFVTAWNWSEYQKSLKESAQQEGTGETIKTIATKEEMKNTHAIGEEFATGTKGLKVKVADVQVSDDISLLDAALVDDDLKKETDGQGKLHPATIQYIKEGNTDALSEVVKSKEVPQKFLYATVEYSNTGKEELSDVLFMGALARIREEEDKMSMMSGWTYEEPADGEEWDSAVNQGLSSNFDMQYYDVHGGERGNNYIPSIQPGETVTVHMGWIVTQEELSNLFLSLDTFGGAYEFTDSSLEMGYVDIRK